MSPGAFIAQSRSRLAWDLSPAPLEGDLGAASATQPWAVLLGGNSVTPPQLSLPTICGPHVPSRSVSPFPLYPHFLQNQLGLYCAWRLRPEAGIPRGSLARTPGARAAGSEFWPRQQHRVTGAREEGGEVEGSLAGSGPAGSPRGDAFLGGYLHTSGREPGAARDKGAPPPQERLSPAAWRGRIASRLGSWSRSPRREEGWRGLGLGGGAPGEGPGTGGRGGRWRGGRRGAGRAAEGRAPGAGEGRAAGPARALPRPSSHISAGRGRISHALPRRPRPPGALRSCEGRGGGDAGPREPEGPTLAGACGPAPLPPPSAAATRAERRPPARPPVGGPSARGARMSGFL